MTSHLWSANRRGRSSQDGLLRALRCLLLIFYNLCYHAFFSFSANMSVPVDFTTRFNELFGPFEDRKVFLSLESLIASLKRFQNETGVNYRIRSSHSRNDGTVFRRTYICTKKGQALKPSQGVRQKPSQQTGCDSNFNVRICDGGYRVCKSMLIHNHPANPIIAQYEPAGRRLESSHLEELKPWLLQNTPSSSICAVVRQEMKKMVSTKDIINIRAKMLANYNSTAYIRELEENLNATGKCRCTVDTENFITHFMFMTNQQEEICRRYGEFIGIDSTYGITSAGYSLFQFVVVDSCGIGIPVFFGFVAQETTASIGHLIRTFNYFVGPIQTRAVITDDSAALQNALSTDLPQARQLLCRVHLLRNLKDRVSSVKFSHCPILARVNGLFGVDVSRHENSKRLALFTCLAAIAGIESWAL